MGRGDPVILNQHIETDTPAGKLMVQMLGAFAEFSEAIQERWSQVSIRHVVTASTGSSAQGPADPKVQGLLMLVNNGQSVTAARRRSVCRATANRWTKEAAWSSQG